MKKIAFAVLMSLTLVGCANEDIYGGNVYSGDQAKEARSISYGTIVSTRPVKIQADNQGVLGTIGGGAIGGIAGSGIGGGTGQAIAAVGAVAGAVIGSKVEEKASQVSALEMVIKKDDGKEIVVVQKAEANLVPGARVRIVGGSRLNVSAL